jgi:hypothetical protein
MAYSPKDWNDEHSARHSTGRASPTQRAEPARKPEREVEHGPPARGARGAGRRLLGLGALLVLIGAVGYGGWRHYQLHTEVIATAEQTRDFVPAVLIAPVRASPATASVFWPGSTLAFNLADIFARASGYICHTKR